MQARIVQVQPEPWPSGQGDVIAMLDATPQWLASRYRLTCFMGTDNLGSYCATVIRLPSGRRLGLLRHENAPYAGVEVHADLHDDVQDAVRELLDAMNLPENRITWMREALATPAVIH